MRVPNETHTRRPWKVRALASDFDLLDVWQFDLHGDADDFERFVAQQEEGMGAAGPVTSGPARWLFALRSWLGEVFGWDEAIERPIPGCAESRVRDRLPETERAELGPKPFEPVYRVADEVLYEISNSTVHALMHLGWVEGSPGEWSPEMAVYVKPRGRFGQAYMRLIDPFRHLIVYPALMRSTRRRWQSRESFTRR